MHLRVYHRTRYVYRLPVSESHNEVRLRPATEDAKRLSFFILKVSPPRRLRHFRDDHFNYVQWFEIPEPHHELIIEATSHLHTSTQYVDGVKPLGATFEDIHACDQIDMLRPFIKSSKYVVVDPEIWRLALDIRDERKDVFETAMAIMKFIYKEWTYAPNTTSSSTHMSEVLHQRRGVCQDFAHIMIGLCRALEIPARYVSGYIYNGPKAELRGAQASHAWCEVWLPNRGWFGLDPTNNTLSDERYVKIATGCDYDDAAPIRGSFNGPPGATTQLEVSVAVDRL
ncbi:MAG: transglutaminase family protein [Verrucomicrobiaceae bacterium]|jgi:transglutaminase-like putative cysteine protease